MARTADVEYKMRMTQELKDKIKASADQYNRSMNADIIARLEESFNTPSFEQQNINKEQLEHITNLAGTAYLLTLRSKIANMSEKEAYDTIIRIMNEAAHGFNALDKKPLLDK
ncbi:Arc family DNA-binding protein [Psychrobacter sp. I-STPA10]|uniref:Arc family DNA-binding protein n=1 Tax=Psychrobacter sp. I-STPA10 TaxID=2585769 RepID=UPI001E4F6CCB|nr:Arc family DNA-binding protein [Psychrobacter sp. I-STPA10]